MKLPKCPFLLLILTSVAIFTSVNCEIVGQEVKNANNDVVFRVLKQNNQLQIPNRHRNEKPSLTLSLQSTSLIDSISTGNGSSSSSNWSLNLKDDSKVNFTVREVSNQTTECHFNWHGENGAGREICFGLNNAFWFNGYQSRSGSWPMNTTNKTISRQQFNFLLDYDRYYDSGLHKEDILIQELLFLNSNGFAILLDPSCPLFIRSQTGNDLCFSVNNSFPYNSNYNESSYFDIKFHIFSSPNARTTIDYVVHHSGLIPKPVAIPEDSTTFANPIWFTWEMINYGDGAALEFVDELMNHDGFKNHSIMLHGWHAHEWDQIAHAQVQPRNSTIDKIHANGYQVGFHMYNPDLDSLELSQKYGINSTGMIIDFTNSESVNYFRNRLQSVQNSKRIDSLLLSANMQIVNRFEVKDSSIQKYPNFMTSKYVETVSQATNVTIISEYGFRTQNLPVWLRLTNYWNTSYDQLLRELIPNVLSVSIAGYSFIVPYSAGGFCAGNRPTEEQFVRMVQASALMPGMSFTKKPWSYSAKVVEITKKFINLHTEHAQTIVELAKKRIQEGSPIIRPMWYVAPEDPKTYSIGDQYMLGEDILVAPVVVIGQTERTVYLIAGAWNDQHGKSYQGPGEFKVAAPLEELPYFKRKV